MACYNYGCFESERTAQVVKELQAAGADILAVNSEVGSVRFLCVLCFVTYMCFMLCVCSMGEAGLRRVTGAQQQMLWGVGKPRAEPTERWG